MTRLEKVARALLERIDDRIASAGEVTITREIADATLGELRAALRTSGVVDRHAAALRDIAMMGMTHPYETDVDVRSISDFYRHQLMRAISTAANALAASTTPASPSPAPDAKPVAWAVVELWPGNPTLWKRVIFTHHSREVVENVKTRQADFAQNESIVVVALIAAPAVGVEEVATVIHKHAVISDADSHNAARAVLALLRPDTAKTYPESCWFAERRLPAGCEWLADVLVGARRHFTTDPLKARQFDTREECQSHCDSWKADGIYLVPVEHGFFQTPPPSAMRPI